MSIKFANEIDRALSEESKHSVALEVRSDTPKPLLDVGLAGLPMYCTRRHIETALGSSDVPHPHNISRQTLETLPELLENPALIVDAMHRPDSVILLTGAKDEIGLPVVAAISTGGRASREDGIFECNFISSVYGMRGIDNLFFHAIANDAILYADKSLLSAYFDRGLLDRLLPGEDVQIIRSSHNVQTFALSADDAPARYFIDMDGTLAQFHADEHCLERMTEPGFFENLPPYEKAIAKLKDYMKAHPESEFYVLSGLTADAPDCREQKNRWLDKYFPEIDQAHRIYTENGDDKSLYIPGGVHAKDILIDDYNKNLEDWQAAGGQSVKFVNHVNDRGLRGKLWEGERIRYDQTGDIPKTLGRLSAPKSSKDMLRDNLQKKVAALTESFRTDPAQIAEFLAFATRFSRYSPNNIRLMMIQNPYARFVAPASSYKKGLPDRDGNNPLVDSPIYIKKGEKAMYIWKPVVKEQVEVDGKWKALYDLDEGEKEQLKAGELERRQQKNFILVPVFDVAQTTLPPEKYPELFGYGVFSQPAEDMVTALSAYSTSILNCPVVVDDLHSTTRRGAYSPSLNRIRLSSMLSGEEKLSTLIHEIGHASLHADGGMRGKSESRIELEADMYALMIEQHYGLEIRESRKAHLAEHYKRWISELPEDTRSDINADMEIFREVCRKYNETVPTMDQYAERYVQYLQAEQAQSETAISKADEIGQEKTPEQLPDAPRQESAPEEPPQDGPEQSDSAKKWNISV